MVPPDDGGEGGGGERNDDEGHVHEMPLVQLVLGLGSGHWYVLVVVMRQPIDGAGSSCGIVPLKELPSRYLRTTRGTTAGGEWERGKGWSGEGGREKGVWGGGVPALHVPSPPSPPRPLPPHAAGRAAAERGGLTSTSAQQ